MFRKLLGLLSDAAVYGASSMISRIVGLLVLFPLTRPGYLVPTDYGIINVLGIVVAVFGPLGNLGMSNAIFRRFNVEKDPQARARVLSTGLTSVTVSTLVVLGLGMVFAGPLTYALLGKTDGVNLVRLSLLTGAATTVAMVPFATLRASRRVKTAATINVLKVLVSVSFTLLLVLYFETGVWGAVVGPLVGEVLLLGVQLALTLREFAAPFVWDTWKRMARYGLPFVPHQLQALGLDLFGIYVIRNLLGLEAAGLYGIAVRFALPVTFVVNSIQASWVPYKFEIHANDPNPQAFFRSAFTYYFAGLSYLWVGVSLWGPEALRLLTTGSFHPAALLIWAVALVPVAQGLYYMAGTGLELTDNTRSIPLVSMAGLITTVAATYLLVERSGAMGAALATSGGWLMMGFVMFQLSQRRFPLSYDWKTVVAFALLAVVTGGIGLQLQEHPLGIRLTYVLLASLLYPLVGLAILLRSSDERHRMLHLVEKVRRKREKPRNKPPASESPATETIVKPAAEEVV